MKSLTEEEYLALTDCITILVRLLSDYDDRQLSGLVGTARALRDERIREDKTSILSYYYGVETR